MLERLWEGARGFIATALTEDSGNYYVYSCNPIFGTAKISAVPARGASQYDLSLFSRFTDFRQYFWASHSIVYDSGSSFFYVADTYNHRILKVSNDPSPTIKGLTEVVAGGAWSRDRSGNVSYTRGTDDGRGTRAKFNVPYGLALQQEGGIKFLYVAPTIKSERST